MRKGSGSVGRSIYCGLFSLKVHLRVEREDDLMWLDLAVWCGIENDGCVLERQRLGNWFLSKSLQYSDFVSMVQLISFTNSDGCWVLVFLLVHLWGTDGLKRLIVINNLGTWSTEIWILVKRETLDSEVNPLYSYHSFPLIFPSLEFLNLIFVMLFRTSVRKKRELTNNIIIYLMSSHVCIRGGKGSCCKFWRPACSCLENMNTDPERLLNTLITSLLLQYQFIFYFAGGSAAIRIFFPCFERLGALPWGYLVKGQTANQFAVACVCS